MEAGGARALVGAVDPLRDVARGEGRGGVDWALRELCCDDHGEVSRTDKPRFVGAMVVLVETLVWLWWRLWNEWPGMRGLREESWRPCIVDVLEAGDAPCEAKFSTWSIECDCQPLFTLTIAYDKRVFNSAESYSAQS